MIAFQPISHCRYRKIYQIFFSTRNRMRPAFIPIKQQNAILMQMENKCEVNILL